MGDLRGIEIQGYRIIDKISEGAFKKVYIGTKIKTMKTYVLKLFIPNKKGRDILNISGRDIAEDFRIESRISSGVGNDKVSHLSLMLKGFYSHELECYVAVEKYCEGMDLFEFTRQLRNNQPVSQETSEDYITQILKGLKELKYFEIDYHGDLKFQNILVDILNGETILKLTDFGQSGKENNNAYSIDSINMGYPATMAPELLVSTKKPDSRTDLWSAGMLLYKMLSGNYMTGFVQPKGWVDMPIMERVQKYDKTIKEDTLRLGQTGINKKIDQLFKEKFHPHLYEILNNTLRINPEERIFPNF